MQQKMTATTDERTDEMAADERVVAYNEIKQQVEM
jgi:hypothetical protein